MELNKIKQLTTQELFKEINILIQATHFSETDKLIFNSYVAELMVRIPE